MFLQVTLAAFFFGFAQIHAQHNSTSDTQDNKTNLTLSPDDQKATERCKKEFPGVDKMIGKGHSCYSDCSGFNSTFRFSRTIYEADGTDCDPGQECLRLHCHNSASITMCKNSMPGSKLQSLFDSGCILLCYGDGNPYAKTFLYKPDGTVCKICAKESDLDYINGTCSSGQCLSNSTSSFDD